MKMTRNNVGLMYLTCLMLSTVGCSKDAKSPSLAYADAKTASSAPMHAHPSEGPHKGDLIELGNEEYHAELVVPTEASAQVTIYVLDSSAAKSVPIEAQEVTVNVADGGSPAQFKLAASPDTDDPQGKSSRFISTDAKLLEFFAEEAVHGTLVLKIKGKQYRGDIDHHEGL